MIDQRFRWVAGPAVLVTAGIVPAAMLTGLPRPPPFVLLPQLVLGIVALGAAGRRHPRWVRLMPFAAAAVSVPVAVRTAPGLDFYGGYHGFATTALPAAAVMLLIGATLLAFGLAARRDYRGVWALLILLTPIGMLALIPSVRRSTTPARASPSSPAWSSMVVASVLVALVGPALVPLVLAAPGRLSPGYRPTGADVGRCPTCGAPSASA